VNKAFPSDNDIDFMICDDVRVEANRKLSLLGFYAANKINAKDIGDKFFIPLAFLIMIKEGEGNYKMRTDVEAPSGKKIIEYGDDTLKKEGAPCVIVFKAINFPLVEEGTYKVDIHLDDKLFNRSFTILHDPNIVPL
jgi:hypothetical protein